MTILFSAGKTAVEKTASAMHVDSVDKAESKDKDDKPLATFDFNKLVTYTMPCCGLKIELFIAIHREDGVTQYRIQKSSEEGVGGIPDKWWISLKISYYLRCED